MATVRVRYGRLHLEGVLTRDVEGRMETGATFKNEPLTLPVDDLLMLLTDDKRELERVTTELFSGYRATGLLFREPPHAPTREQLVEHREASVKKLRRQIRAWRRDGIPELFLRAAERASRGRFTAELGPHLERVRFGGASKPDEVPDLLALAAWCLDQALRQGRLELRNCAYCERPFLSTGQARYCQRLARGSAGQTCQDVGKVKDYRERQRAAAREKGGSDDCS